MLDVPFSESTPGERPAVKTALAKVEESRALVTVLDKGMKSSGFRYKQEDYVPDWTNPRGASVGIRNGYHSPDSGCSLTAPLGDGAPLLLSGAAREFARLRRSRG
jgi:hypothetical protein